MASDPDLTWCPEADREEWRRESARWRGHVLTGRYAHWCIDWDDLPIDETTPEWPCICSDELKARRGGGDGD